LEIYVYILKCSDASYYVGLTRAGLEKRIGEHNSGIFRGYTSSRLPVELVWQQNFQRLTDAIACERRIKGWRREKRKPSFAAISMRFESWLEHLTVEAIDSSSPFDKLRVRVRVELLTPMPSS
jgi:putative endonuclease